MGRKKSYPGAIVFFIVLFVGCVLPMIGMLNCSGWNEGSMHSTDCLIDTSWTRAYADWYYGFILFSVFLGLIPVVVYTTGVSVIAVILYFLVALLTGHYSRAKTE
jgi:hypothetical protein